MMSESANLKKVITVNSNSSIFDALKQMQVNFIKRVVVVANGNPVGIVTERDINRFLENDKTSRAIDEILIKNVMQKKLITITDGFEDHFEQCAARMETFKIGSVIILNDAGDLTAIVSRTDITKAFAIVYGGKYKVRDFMTKKVVTCRKSDSLKFALSLMNRNEVSRLVVTDEQGKPVGLITTNTLLVHSDYFTQGHTRSRDYLLPMNKGRDLSVGDLVNDELLCIDEDDDLANAASLMIKNKISGVPVINERRELLGIVTKSDIVRAFATVGPNEELKSKYKELY